MAKLVKISVDPESIKKTGRYKDKEGYSLHGVFKRDYIKTKDVLFISNGVLLKKYKFPKIKTKFRSPMLNFFNLHLCGGWFWPNVSVKKEILRRVIKGLKPMGDIVDKIKKISEIADKAEVAGLKYKIIPHFLEGHRVITFCKDGEFEELSEFEKLFLNEKLIECLHTLDLICSKLELKEISKWINIELKGFIENTDKLADLPSYREFNDKLKHMGTEVPERIHWNLFIPLSEILLKIKNNENISRIVEHDVLDDLFGKYFAGITIAIIESMQLKQITTGVLKNIEKIYKYLNKSIEKKEIAKKRKEIRNGVLLSIVMCKYSYK